MSLRKFQKNDILTNTMKAYPSCEFVIFDGKIYHNNMMVHSGAKNWSVTNVTGGYLNLYEYNVDRHYVSSGRTMFAATNSAGDEVTVADTGLIYPWIVKTGERFAIGTVGYSSSLEGESWTYDYNYGDVIAGQYPMSASISREYLWPSGAASDKIESLADGEDTSGTTTTPRFRHYYALRNTFESNAWRSEDFRITGAGTTSQKWDKDYQEAGLISIPSIFYGTRVEPGTVSARWYYTGSLIGELQDTKQNGVLYEVSGTNVGEAAGVILYDQGEIYLTGAWDLGPTLTNLPLDPSSSNTYSPSWVFFGAGALDGVTSASPNQKFVSASFGLSFSGSTETQVMTMFAMAGRDQANYSNNPTYLQYGQQLLEMTSSQTYEENSSRYIYNTVSSSYVGYEAPFKRQVYISRIGIYDKHKNLIGIATLADPVLKKEDQDLTFKLRLDI